MRLGIRGRLFLVSVALILAVASTSASRVRARSASATSRISGDDSPASTCREAVSRNDVENPTKRSACCRRCSASSRSAKSRWA